MLFKHIAKRSAPLLILALSFSNQLSAQNQMLTKSVPTQIIAYAPFKDDVNVYELAQHQAEFDGGLAAFFKYLDANLKMPPEAQKVQADGRVFLSFVVNVDGGISNVTVRRFAYSKRLEDGRTAELDAETDKTLIEALNQEAVRVIKAMPKWKAGKQGEQAVRSVFSMPIIFK